MRLATSDAADLQVNALLSINAVGGDHVKDGFSSNFQDKSTLYAGEFRRCKARGV